MTESTLKRIWTKRGIKHLTQKSRGSTPESGFDFTKTLTPYDEYSNDNYRDGSIQDFRDILSDLLEGHLSEHLDKDLFEVVVRPDSWYNNELIGNIQGDEIKIIASRIHDQAQFTIYLSFYGVFSVSWYKNRGRIDSIINTEYGQPARLVDLTFILIALGLEDELTHHWDSDETIEPPSKYVDM